VTQYNLHTQNHHDLIKHLAASISNTDGPFGSGRRVTSSGGICPKNSLSGGMNRQFQAKTQKSNLYIAISAELLIRPTRDLRTKLKRQNTYTSWIVHHYNTANPTWLMTTVLKAKLATWPHRRRWSDLDEIWQAMHNNMPIIRRCGRNRKRK